MSAGWPLTTETQSNKIETPAKPEPTERKPRAKPMKDRILRNVCIMVSLSEK
jgi:hypothetical protein